MDRQRPSDMVNRLVWPRPLSTRLLIVYGLSLAVLLAGCLSDPSREGPEEPEGPAPEADPQFYGFDCGPGHDLQRADGVCYGAVDDPDHTMGEPQLALHPARSGSFVIAVSDGRAGPAGEAPDLVTEARGIAVYTTDDDGLSFERHRVPLEGVGGLPFNAHLLAADPSIAYDSHGVLHLSAFVATKTPGSLAPGPDFIVFYMQSPDDGATWTAPVVLDDEGANDREWLTVAPDDTVFVTWRDFNAPGSKVAWSNDQGATWSDPLVLEGCRQISQVVTVQDEHLVGCKQDSDTVVHRLDPDLANATVRGTATDACPTNSVRLSAGVNGTLVAACYYGKMAISHDAGRNWGPTVDLVASARIDDDWPPGIGPNIFAVEADPWGGVHVLLTHFPTGPEDQVLGMESTRPAAHIVLDGDLNITQEVDLKEHHGQVTTKQGYGWADDYYQIAFEKERGLLVWASYEWTSEFAWIRPEDPSPGNSVEESPT